MEQYIPEHVRIKCIEIIEENFSDTYCIYHFTNRPEIKEKLMSCSGHYKASGYATLESLAMIAGMSDIKDPEKVRSSINGVRKTRSLLQEFRNMGVYMSVVNGKIFRFYQQFSYATDKELLWGDKALYGQRYMKDIFPFHPGYIRAYR